MGWFTRNTQQTLPWKQLTSEEEMDHAIAQSHEKPVVFFKHSTRCSISSMALNGFESGWDHHENAALYFLDLLQYPSVSGQMAEKLNVRHESPQVIVLKNGKVVHHSSHNGIQAGTVKKAVQKG